MAKREIMYQEYSHIVPKDWFWTTWEQFSTPIVQPGEDYFVALGDSFTCGYQMESYSQTWVSLLSDATGLGHVNLAWNGASIEATCRFLDRSLSVDPAKLHIVMLPYPWRSESCLWFKGERNRRIKDTGDHAGRCGFKLGSALERYKHDRVVFTNTWGLTNEVFDAIRDFAVQYPNFMLNQGEWLDRALDGEHGHAGPLTHGIVAKELHDFIKNK